MRVILKEPLLHFFLIGLGLFVAYELIVDDAEIQGDETIRVRGADIERLAETWTEQWQRVPTSSEMQRFVDDFVREEILYREALALGLDENDAVVRRRLAQKYAFISQDVEEDSDPDDEVLRQWHRRYIQRYTDPAKITFTHIFFESDDGDESAAGRARQLLEEFSQSQSAPERAPERGDDFNLRSDYSRTTPFEIREEFGTEFGDALEGMTVGEWDGPVRSKFGIHLVRVAQRHDVPPSTYEEVRDRVLNDWLYEQNRRIDSADYEELLKKYEIVIDESARDILSAEGAG